MIINKLYLNNNYSSNPNLSLVKARNVRYDDNFDLTTNEEGFKKLHTLPENICGIIPTDKELIVFCTNNNGSDYIYRCNDSQLTLSLKGNLQLSTEYPVTGKWQYNNEGDLIVVFNDKRSKLRVFNFDNPYMSLNPVTKEFISPIDGVNKLNINPNYKIPSININTINEGNLPKGSYQVSISYFIGKNETLNWTLPSEVIHIGRYRDVDIKYESYDSAAPNNEIVRFKVKDKYQLESENNTDKALKVELSNIDTNYKRYQLVIIHRTDTGVFVYKFGDFDTNITNHVITVLPEETLSIEDVTIPTISYEIVNDITITMNRLAAIGVKSDLPINYQKFANNIKVRYKTNDDYSNYNKPFNTFVIGKTALYDEVYAINIELWGKDGSSKGVYHIPGRAPSNFNNIPITNECSQSELTNYNSANDITDKPITKYRYQLYNNADSYTATNKQLGYWQNDNEFYPTTEDFEIWDVDVNGNTSKIGDLGGQKVRHHKMPDFNKLYGNDSINKNPDKSIIIYLEDVKFPKELLDIVQCFTISYNVRNSNNSTVHAHYPLIRNTFILDYNSNLIAQHEVNLGNVDHLSSYTFSSVRFNDFGILQYKPNIQNPYIKALYKTNPNNAISNVQPIDNSTIKGFSNAIYNINDNLYVPKDNSAANPDNGGREESLILNLDTLPNDSVNTLVCALKSDLDNVYFPFYNQRVVSINRPTYLQDNVYKYTSVEVNDFDSYISTYYSMLYRGNQSLEVDKDTGLIKRTRVGSDDQSSASVIQLFKCFSLSTINIDYKTLHQYKSISKQTYDASEFAEVINFLSFGLLGSKDSHYSYLATFVVDPKEDFNFSYNRMYSYVNNILPLYVYDYNNVFVQDHPYRVIRSANQSKESLVFNWRYFSALEYYEMPKHRGIGISISGLDKLLLIHMEHSLYVAQSKDKINIPDGDAYIGVSDIFERDPDELLPTNRGTAGIQSRFGNAIGEFGYIFSDTYDSTIYIYSNNSLSQITDITVRALFKKYMKASSGNPLTGNDVIFGIDESNKRIIITSLGNVNFTMSYCYNPEISNWVSFHDYTPSLMVSNRLGSYSVNRYNLKELYKFNADPLEIPHGNYYGNQYESYIDILINDNPKTDKILQSVGFQSGVENEQNNIHKLFIYTRNQCTKVYNIGLFNTMSDYDKVRFLNGYWNYGLIRDYTNDIIVQNIVDDFGNINLNAINENKNWFELGDLSDRAFIVRLITNNSTNMVFRDIDYNVTINRR